MGTLNGSADLLAKALRQVVKEAAQEAIGPVYESMRENFEQVDQKLGDLEKDSVHIKYRVDQHRKELDSVVKKR